MIQKAFVEERLEESCSFEVFGVAEAHDEGLRGPQTLLDGKNEVTPD